MLAREADRSKQQQPKVATSGPRTAVARLGAVSLVGWFLLTIITPLQVKAQNEPNLPAEDQDLPEPDLNAPVDDGPEVEGPSEPPPPPSPPANTNNTPPSERGMSDAGTPSGQPGSASESVPQRGASAVPAGQELVNIDFPEPTEIKDIIKAVALWTGKNVILDRNVNGKVQIISPRKVTKEEAYQAFLSALNLLGLTTVETGKVIKIMPVRTAVKGNLKTFLGASWTPMTDEIITQIVPLKYIDAKEIQATLSRIVSSNSMIAYQPTNTLIISDSGYKVRRVLDILELLDVQGQQAQVAIVPIRYAEAKSIADKVGEIFKNTTVASKKGASASSYRSYKIMTDERTNSVVIFGPPRTITDVKALVRKFDIPLDDPSRQSTIHVRPLDYADAKKLAATLSALASGSKNNRTIRRPPIPPPRGAIPGQSISEPLSVAELGDDVKIAPDESSNALLITGSHAAYQTINSIIRKLDIRRAQVFVEADILDINMNNGFNFGTSIFAGRGGPQGSAMPITWQATPLAPLVLSQAQQNQNTSSNVSNTQLQQVAQALAGDDLNIGILSGSDITIDGLGKFRPGALIRMLKSDANTRVLASPHILTSNNEEAVISVGETVYFRSQEVTPQTGAVVNKPEKEKGDLSLTLKPNISHSNYITLSVNLEANSVVLDNQSQLPKLDTRKTKQLVTVKNGQTVVISGLMRTGEYETFKKIPLLGDIPILGWLFRNSVKIDNKTNLTIFLTPHVIHGADDLAAVYKTKLRERDEFLEALYGSDFRNSAFYESLPTEQDGAYQSDEVDRMEKERHEQMLKQMYENSSAPGPNAPITVEGQGQGGSGDGASDDSPVYVPLAPEEGDGGGAGGSFDPGGMPEPLEPPPPPEPMGDIE